MAAELKQHPRYHVGVIGLGAVAEWYLKAIDTSPRWSLAVLCDTDSQRLAQRRIEWPDVASASTLADALRAEHVDAVVLALPNDSHAEVIREALLAGVHVCCEKPLTLASSDAQYLARTAESSGLVLQTASHRRYNTNLHALQVQLPARNRIKAIRSRYWEDISEHSAGESWYMSRDRCGGGCIVDNGPNAIDVVLGLVGELSPTTACIADLRLGVEFIADVRLQTPDGIHVKVELDWRFPGQQKDITLELDDGCIVYADLLAGFTGLKGSLDHEYCGIMEDFAGRIDRRDCGADNGVRLVEIVEQIYDLAQPVDGSTLLSRRKV